MSKVLTIELYEKLKDLKTPNGYTLDHVIQTGVDNPGHPYIMTVGCVAGDEVCVFMFEVPSHFSTLTKRFPARCFTISFVSIIVTEVSHRGNFCAS